MTARPVSARQVAFDVIERWKNDGVFAAAELDRVFGQTPGLGAADRGLASELVYGVIRRHGTLAAVLEPRLKRPRQQVEDRLWTLLEVGAYPLLFFARSSAHAAVNETVELARWLEQPRWTGFANAVLRSLDRDMVDSPATGPAADSLPRDRSSWIGLARPLLPDPVTDPAAYAAAAGSLPGWLVDRWLERFEFDELLRLAAWFAGPVPNWARVNPLRSNAETVADAFADAGVDSTFDRSTGMLRLAGTAWVPGLPGFDEGWFTIQDPSAAAAAKLLAPAPGQQVLDLCAAPGTKSTQLAELMQDTGRVVAADSNADRLSRVAAGAGRLGLTIIEPIAVDGTGRDVPPGPFDAALVDVPCSNTGVLGKRPEVRWRLKPDEPARLARLQRSLLETAASRLKPDGRLVYSTCSIEPDENQDVVQAFLQDHAEFELLEAIDHRPGQPGDGGFQALLRQT